MSEDVRQALAELVQSTAPSREFHDWGKRCQTCFSFWLKDEDEQHKPDCSWSKARELLKEAK